MGPELWGAFLPVGVSGTQNTYADFADQLRPYLDKLLTYYAGSVHSTGRYYFVSNDPGWPQLQRLWDSLPRTAIDFYGKPGPLGETNGSCLIGDQNVCYVRWPLETYSSFDAFHQDYVASPFVGEGWQTADIFTSHMNSSLFDMVEVNVPGDSGAALVSADEARQLTQAGLIIALAGTSAAGFAPPRADTTVDIKTVLASDNVALAYLYGKSGALAALGTPSVRGHYANYPVLYSSLKNGAAAYLGAAHRAQLLQNHLDVGYEQCVLDGHVTCSYPLSEQMNEMLLGDPFLDLK